jgi:hypothetical protein
MSDTPHSPLRLSDLPPEELDRLAHAHVDGLFGEVRGAGEHVRTEWNPLKLAVKHPLATAAIVGVAGFAAAQLLQGRRREARGSPATASEPIGRTLISGLAGVAATALPKLLMTYLQQRGGTGEPDVPKT